MKEVLSRSSALILLAIALPGCGSSTTGSLNPTPIPTPTPAPPTGVATLIDEDNFSGLGAQFLAGIPFDTTISGTIEATVDWTFARDNVEVYLVRGSCTIDEFNNDTCPCAAFSESTTAKPERIRATNQNAGSFTLYIGNRGPDEESVSFQIFLTPGPGGASTTIRRTIRVGPGQRFQEILPRR